MEKPLYSQLSCFQASHLPGYQFGDVAKIFLLRLASLQISPKGLFFLLQLPSPRLSSFLFISDCYSFIYYCIWTKSFHHQPRRCQDADDYYHILCRMLCDFLLFYWSLENYKLNIGRKVNVKRILWKIKNADQDHQAGAAVLKSINFASMHFQGKHTLRGFGIYKTTSKLTKVFVESSFKTKVFKNYPTEFTRNIFSFACFEFSVQLIDTETLSDRCKQSEASQQKQDKFLICFCFSSLIFKFSSFSIIFLNL